MVYGMLIVNSFSSASSFPLCGCTTLHVHLLIDIGYPQFGAVSQEAAVSRSASLCMDISFYLSWLDS